MRTIFCMLFFATNFTSHAQQNVGIGTSSPDAKAMLDISSTTKGLLIPRMSTSQRLGISAAPNGLMVYDTDIDGLYHYTGTAWTAVLNGTYWSRPITSRKRIANLNDSVGIGTNSPTEWLDVDGNIRSRNNITADNGVYATGTISSSTGFATSGNIIASGLIVASGDITTNSDLIINSATATLQLKSSSVNKGYFQLSGSDVRMGTNSGNSTGDLIIRMNGNDRVVVNAAGDINLDGKITRSAVTGASSLVPVCYGFVNGDGSIFSGTGNFSVNKTGTGIYKITCNYINIYSIIIATSVTGNNGVGAYQDSPTLMVFSTTFAPTGELQDNPFYFVVYKPS